jgi:hypothetical protein
MAAGGFTAVGTIASLLVLLPRVTVNVDDPIEPSNSMSASFTIANNSIIPLWDAGAALAFRRIAAPALGVYLESVAPMGTTFLRPSWLHHKLAMDEHFTVTPAELVSYATEGDIWIVVSYQPWFLPIRCEKRFHFVTRPESNGRSYWFAMPSS